MKELLNAINKHIFKASFVYYTISMRHTFSYKKDLNNVTVMVDADIEEFMDNELMIYNTKGRVESKKALKWLLKKGR